MHWQCSVCGKHGLEGDASVCMPQKVCLNMRASKCMPQNTCLKNVTQNVNHKMRASKV